MYFWCCLSSAMWWNKFNDQNDIWTQNLIPTMHYTCFQTLIKDILQDDWKTRKYEFLIPAFDKTDQSLTDILSNINQQLNPTSNVTSETISSSSGTTSVALNVKKNPVLEKFNVKPLLEFLPTPDTSNSSITLSTHWETIWTEFIQANGLSPISVIVVGPPRVGKSAFCQDLAQKYVISYLPIYLPNFLDFFQN